MKQQIMVSPGKIQFREIPIPNLNEDDVLIKIMRIGLCGSDIHVYHGKHPYVTSYPITQGHEVSGKVEKVGSSVIDFKKGDKITIQPQEVCGECYPCKNDKYHCCDNLKVMGFQTTGAASQYFVCDSKKLVKLPQEFSYEEGAMIEPLAVACHALKRVNNIKGFNILVLGAGPIGNLVAQTAKGLGAKSVLITDISDFRLELAKRLGIDHTVNPLKTDLSKKIIEVFGQKKADLIVECVGNSVTINDAINNARKCTDIIIIGVFSEKPTINLGLVQDHELRLIGTAMYQTKDYLKAIELVIEKKIHLKPLMTNHFQFEEYKQAFEFLDKKKDQAMKVFIDINNE
ncbi:MAG: zinc-dependent alcohol dehydrogenase [Candidatus Hodarchaeales archaeon]|jgi:L-iditol 2-dehydrogenase